MINYFNFNKFQNKYLLTNDLGEYIFVDKEDLYTIISKEVNYESDLGRALIKKHFAYNGSQQEFLEKIKYPLRESKGHLFKGPSLHIFVVTDICNFKCLYCQAQSSNNQNHAKMDINVAEKAINIALQSPEKYLSFEFQGGEPLLNFPVIKHIVEYTNSNKKDKMVEFSLVTNLTLLDEEMSDFFILNNINISTSLDGNSLVHDNNRKYINGGGTYNDVIEKITFLKRKKINVGAIQTTTSTSIKYAKEIIDEYVKQGIGNIFLRPLTPLGYAKELWTEIGYSPEEYTKFYVDSLEYIISLNKNGIKISEGFATICLKEILWHQSANYMELRSPCGATIGQIAYFYNGDIYTCDEGRMLAEMGDKSFKIGNVLESSYDEIMDSDICKATCAASTLECIPQCCDCVYLPYCGTCPVLNLALEGDIFSKHSNNYRCALYKGMFNAIFDILYRDDEKEIDILKSWI